MDIAFLSIGDESFQRAEIVDSKRCAFSIEMPVVTHISFTEDQYLFLGMSFDDLVFGKTIDCNHLHVGAVNDLADLLETMAVCVGLQYRYDLIKRMKRLQIRQIMQDGFPVDKDRIETLKLGCKKVAKEIKHGVYTQNKIISLFSLYPHRLI